MTCLPGRWPAGALGSSVQQLSAFSVAV